MGKKKWKKPRNVALIKAEPVTLATTSAHSWKNIGYKIVVAVTRKTVGIEVKETPSKVIGQCLGMRDDGQAFFAKVDLPWIWGPDFLWQPIARRRLDSFLSPDCRCVSKDGGTLVCKPLHEDLNIKWSEDDAALARANQVMLEALDSMPIPGPTPGPLDMLRVMNLKYPWCRYDVAKNEWLCLICQMRENAFTNNSSYRNQFIFKHAECGNALAWNYKPKVAPDVRERAIREVMEQLEKSMQLYGRAAASEKTYQDLFAMIATGADPERFILSDDEVEMAKLLEGDAQV